MLPGHLDRAAALATEPHGRRRHAHPQALPRGTAARRLRADRARPRADAGSRRAGPLGLRVGLEHAAHHRGVDLGAIFRLAPGLVSTPTACAEWSSSSSRRQQDGETATYALIARRTAPSRSRRRRRAALTPRSAATRPPGSARSRPTRDRSELEITGDRRLAERLLDGAGADAARQLRAERAANAALVATGGSDSRGARSYLLE